MNYHINSMTKLVSDIVEPAVETGFEEDTKQKIKSALEEYWRGKVAFIWHLEDIMGRAKEREIELTKDQGLKILSIMDKRHDCSIGMNWDVIDYYIDDEVD